MPVGYLVNRIGNRALIFVAFLMCFLANCAYADQPILSKAIPYVLSSDDLKHGESQIEHMLNDRERMKECVCKGDPVWNWTVRQFAGEYTGTRIWWSSAPLKGYPGVLAFSSITAVHPSSITVQETDDGYLASGEQMWSAAIFELINVRNAEELRRIWGLALEKHASEKEFIELVTRHEYKALSERLLFYGNVWQPQANKRGMKTHAWYWNIDLPKTYEDWIVHFKNDSPYLSYYRNVYDACMTPTTADESFSKCLLPVDTFIRSANKTDNQRVHIVGIIHIQPEETALYPNKLVLTNTNHFHTDELLCGKINALWLDFCSPRSIGADPILLNTARQYNGSHVLVEGMFQADKHGPMNRYFGTIVVTNIRWTPLFGLFNK